MAFEYKAVVPWGRNLDEYRRMFDLSDEDLKLRILGCGDGPASFNVENNQSGGNVISVDPIYGITREQIKKRIDETYVEVISQTRQNQEKFVWDTIGTVDNLGTIRMEAMRLFLDDYDQGKAENRYIDASLPSLPFSDQEFNISLSSHFLFLYTDNLTVDFHIQAITEMLRVSEEVRIFPLLDFNATRSDHLPAVIDHFKEVEPEIRSVNYEFQKGGNEVLIIRRCC